MKSLKDNEYFTQDIIVFLYFYKYYLFILIVYSIYLYMKN